MDRAEAERIYLLGKEAVIAKLLELDALVTAREKALATLLGNSTNSNKPPSSDGPEVKRYPKKIPGKKKHGGQPGHKGCKRELLPVEDMDRVHNLYPERCHHCQAIFQDQKKIPSQTPLRHQTFELPPIHLIQEEYRCHTLTCSCGHKTTAQLPGSVANSQFGPRLHAAIAWLGTAHRVSKRGVADILHNLFGLHISTGAVCLAAERVSQACAPVVGSIKRYSANALALNIDETGWKCQGKRRYLWTFVSSLAVLFVISPSRGSKVLKEVLGDFFPGTITSDDHSAYRKYHRHGTRQLCWAHIIRKLKALKELPASPQAYLFARNMLAEIGRMFAIWHAFPDSGCSRRQLWLATALVRGRMKALCLRYQHCETKDVSVRANSILNTWDCLFTFLAVKGVEPTNNAAERSLRPFVQYRKLAFGSQSEWGERFVERIFSVTRTCQMQRINPFNFLAELMTASFSEKQLPVLPALLPN